ncbi:MAG TPA: 5-oxoprolinase subunit PxpB [Bacillus bacterium]|nr:5-oxoprolinase subunit PxpB [Bacillus sp. (in: firmicutes)]
MVDYQLHPLGDRAVMIELGSSISADILRKLQVFTTYLEEHPPEWLIEYIPAFTTLAIFYEPMIISKQCNFCRLPYDVVCEFIKDIFLKLAVHNVVHSRVIEIPVCYGGELGPDLETVANINGLTVDEVIQIHSTGDYIVYMIGFAPGFPYIGGMSEKIAAPRLETPRLKIPERSVGIAGMQTGIYPIATPGGWQLIGRTPLRLFNPENEQPSLLQAGDKIRFRPISRAEYLELEQEG